MAILTLQRGERQLTANRLTSDRDIASFLAPYGVLFERWDVPESVRQIVAQPALDDAQKRAVLAGFGDQLARLAAERGYTNSDMVVLHPETPELDDALAKFDKVHYHTDEEVRFIVDGRGVFGFEGPDNERFELEVHAGEYIVVPPNAWHWFTLCEDRRIKAIRLFQDMSGWVPHYRDPIAAGGSRGA